LEPRLKDDTDPVGRREVNGAEAAAFFTSLGMATAFPVRGPQALSE
jgi:hypothetical protein